MRGGSAFRPFRSWTNFIRSVSCRDFPPYPNFLPSRDRGMYRGQRPKPATWFASRSVEQTRPSRTGCLRGKGPRPIPWLVERRRAPVHSPQREGGLGDPATHTLEVQQDLKGLPEREPPVPVFSPALEGVRGRVGQRQSITPPPNPAARREGTMRPAARKKRPSFHKTGLFTLPREGWTQTWHWQGRQALAPSARAEDRVKMSTNRPTSSRSNQVPKCSSRSSAAPAFCPCCRR